MAKIPVLLPQRCVLKGPKMLHWLPTLSGLVATRPGLRIALGTATILLVFVMAVTSLVRAEGPLFTPIRAHWTCQRLNRYSWIWESSWTEARGFWQCWTSIKKKNQSATCVIVYSTSVDILSFLCRQIFIVCSLTMIL